METKRSARNLRESNPAAAPGLGGAKRGGASGFTLLEIALYSALALILGAPLVSIVLASARSTTENDTFNWVAERNRTALLRVEKELRRAIGSTVMIDGGGTVLTYTAPAGFDGAAIIPGENVRFEVRCADGEKLDGKDNNKNGIIDEGVLVRRDVVTGQESTVSSGLDVTACGFAPAGTGFSVTMTSIGTFRKGGEFTVSRSTTVYPRN